MTLEYVHDVFIHKSDVNHGFLGRLPLGIEAGGFWVFCIVRIDVEIVAHENRPGFKPIPHVLIIFPFQLAI